MGHHSHHIVPVTTSHPTSTQAQQHVEFKRPVLSPLACTQHQQIEFRPSLHHLASDMSSIRFTPPLEILSGSIRETPSLSGTPTPPGHPINDNPDDASDSDEGNEHESLQSFASSEDASGPEESNGNAFPDSSAHSSDSGMSDASASLDFCDHSSDSEESYVSAPLDYGSRPQSPSSQQNPLKRRRAEENHTAASCKRQTSGPLGTPLQELQALMEVEVKAQMGKAGFQMGMEAGETVRNIARKEIHEAMASLSGSLNDNLLEEVTEQKRCIRQKLKATRSRLESELKAHKAAVSGAETAVADLSDKLDHGLDGVRRDLQLARDRLNEQTNDLRVAQSAATQRFENGLDALKADQHADHTELGHALDCARTRTTKQISEEVSIQLSLYDAEFEDPEECEQRLKDEIEDEICQNLQEEIKDQVMNEFREEFEQTIREDTRKQVKDELKQELKQELRDELGRELRNELRNEFRASAATSDQEAPPANATDTEPRSHRYYDPARSPSPAWSSVTPFTGITTDVTTSRTAPSPPGWHLNPPSPQSHQASSNPAWPRNDPGYPASFPSYPPRPLRFSQY
ncbi:MAG: hypothetical protein M1831_001910 [Alyxoria varia]|nr:MAG: hypothetical protein M1831_001910 [Alyxoria varia]